MEREVKICSHCGVVFYTDVCPVCQKSACNIENLLSVQENEIRRYLVSLKGISDILGGGVAEGSCILVSGEPGCGKSTLLLQLASDLQEKHGVLYFSLEEEIGSLKSRAIRLGVHQNNIIVSTTSDIDCMIDEIERVDEKVIIIDSLQMISNSRHNSGSISAGKFAINKLLEAHRDRTYLIVNQITKSGKLSGSKMIEHMVDVVLKFENLTNDIKEIYLTKNRFGSIKNRAKLKMTEKGFV